VAAGGLTRQTDIHTHTHTYTHTHMHAYIHTYTHAHIHAYMHASKHTYTHIHTYIHACMHACMYTYIKLELTPPLPLNSAPLFCYTIEGAEEAALALAAEAAPGDAWLLAGAGTPICRSQWWRFLKDSRVLGNGLTVSDIDFLFTEVRYVVYIYRYRYRYRYI